MQRRAPVAKPVAHINLVGVVLDVHERVFNALHRLFVAQCRLHLGDELRLFLPQGVVARRPAVCVTQLEQCEHVPAFVGLIEDEPSDGALAQFCRERECGHAASALIPHVCASLEQRLRRPLVAVLDRDHQRRVPRALVELVRVGLFMRQHSDDLVVLAQTHRVLELARSEVGDRQAVVEPRLQLEQRRGFELLFGSPRLEVGILALGGVAEPLGDVDASLALLLHHLERPLSRGRVHHRFRGPPAKLRQSAGSARFRRLRRELALAPLFFFCRLHGHRGRRLLVRRCRRRRRFGLAPGAHFDSRFSLF